MARLYANENFPLEVSKELGRLGHDVLTVQEAGNAGRAISDHEVLDFAVRQDRAVMTLNRRDFIRLHNTVPGHAGIIVCTQDEDTARQAQQIHRSIEQIGDIWGKLVRVVRPLR